jgi:hypothetical protein
VTIGIVAALGAAGIAQAAKTTHRLEGPVAGDANASVAISVVVKNGEPRKVKGLRYENLDKFCDQDDEVGYETPAGETSGSAGKNIGPGIESDNSFRWVSNPSDPARSVNIVGKVKQHGKKVTGLLEVFFNDEPCKAEGKFTATK